MTRATIAAALITGALLATGCGDSGDADDASPPATSTRAPATRTVAPATPGSGAATASAEQEVTGIVGAVNPGARTIEITRTAGADVRIIEVTPLTRIRSAAGARVAFGDIRPSNRIIARGTVDASSGALEAAEIDVQDVVGPGPAPGG